MSFELHKNCWVCAKWMLHSTRFIVIPPRNGNCDEASPATAECINHFVYTQQFLSNAKLTLNLPIQTKFVALTEGRRVHWPPAISLIWWTCCIWGAAECRGGRRSRGVVHSELTSFMIKPSPHNWTRELMRRPQMHSCNCCSAVISHDATSHSTPSKLPVSLWMRVSRHLNIYRDEI